MPAMGVSPGMPLAAGVASLAVGGVQHGRWACRLGRRVLHRQPMGAASSALWPHIFATGEVVASRLEYMSWVWAHTPPGGGRRWRRQRLLAAGGKAVVDAPPQSAPTAACVGCMQPPCPTLPHPHTRALAPAGLASCKAASPAAAHRGMQKHYSQHRTRGA